MDAGLIRQFASPAAVYDDPEDLFVAGFMGSPSMNIVRGRVVRDGGFRVEVKDEEGMVRFPVPGHLADAVAAYEGKDVELGLRPETITRQGTQKPGKDLFVFERAVDVVEPTGPDTMLVFTLGGIEAIARVHPEDQAPVGAAFSFEVDMAKVKLFDPATGAPLRT